MAGRGRGRGETSDRELAKSLISGEEQRFDELYERFHGRVFGFVLRRVGNPYDAEDVTQEVFLQIHRSIASYQGRSSLGTWILGIAQNVTRRHFRGPRPAMVSLDRATRSGPMRVQPFGERRLDARRAIERCDLSLAQNRGVEHLEIFRLFYGGGQPLRAISNETGRPTDSVKDSLRRSRNLLLRDVHDVTAALAATRGRA